MTAEAVEQARERAAVAADRLRAAEQSDPTSPSWDAEYDAAATASRAAVRRLEALESLRAAQLELIAALRKEPDARRKAAPPLLWAGFICHGQAEL